jgi:RNA polymerase sigma factor (sigma-70 family)
VERHVEWATKIANKFSRDYPHLRDDCRSEALNALVEAALRFEPERGVPFPAYARWRIKGALCDLKPRPQNHLLGKGYTYRLDDDHDVAENDDAGKEIIDALDEFERLLRYFPRESRPLLRMIGEGLSIAAASRLLGIGRQTCSRQFHSARRTYGPGLGRRVGC